MQQTSSYAGPLAGLNVIDFGWYYAGPMAAMLLADQGANVIHITKPGASELPDQQYQALNRNKKQLALDLKTQEGRDQAMALIEKADVVIENFRPSVMKRLGLDYANVKKRNAGLIYLSLPGFASTDIKHRDTQAWEGVLSAASGHFRHFSLFREMLGYPPLYTPVPVCSVYGSINGAVAIMAALIAREKHHQGTVIEVPLVLGGLLPLSFSFMSGQKIVNMPEDLAAYRYQPASSREAQTAKLEEARLATLPYGYKDYVCGDGRHINFTLLSKFTAPLIKVLGIEKQLYDEGFTNAGDWAQGLANNMGGSAGSGMDAKHKKRFAALVAKALLAKGAEEWEALFHQHGIPAATVRSRSEWMAIPALTESGIFTELETEEGPLKMPGQLVDTSGPEGTQYSLKPSPVKTITHAEAIALFEKEATCQNSKSEAAPLRKGDLLKGLKVLDMGNILAAPIAGHVLAEYGADVVKADSAHDGAYYPGLISMISELNQGKQSVIFDAKTQPGQSLLKKMISWADIVTHNVLDDTGKRLGISHTQMQAIKPGIISMQISAYGGSLRNGWETKPGFDDLLQSANGLKAHMGSTTAPHWHGHIATGDVPGGLSSAFAALLGYYQKLKTGYGAECRTSLARAANFSQLPWMLMQNGNCDWGEPRGQFALGMNWWQRLYECSDGWIYVGTKETEAASFFHIVTGLPYLEAAKENLTNQLETAFKKQGCDIWLSTLRQADIGCHRVMNLDDIREASPIHPADSSTANLKATEIDTTFELLRWAEHPAGTAVHLLAPDHVRVGEEQSYYRPFSAERLGASTRKVLQMLGYGEAEVQELIRLKIALDYYPPLGSIRAYNNPV